MVHRFEARVRKIETALRGPAQLRILSIQADDDEARERATRDRLVREMIAAGQANDGDMFIFVRMFA
jgi:hypothetical protein